jgi:hypothetical protein
VKLSISPTTIDFGSVKLFAKSAPHTVKVTNLGTAPVLMNGNGGNAAQFPKSQNHMYYQFSPSALGPVTGSTGSNWNGQTFSFTFKGIGG